MEAVVSANTEKLTFTVYNNKKGSWEAEDNEMRKVWTQKPRFQKLKQILITLIQVFVFLHNAIVVTLFRYSHCGIQLIRE